MSVAASWEYVDAGLVLGPIGAQAWDDERILVDAKQVIVPTRERGLRCLNRIRAWQAVAETANEDKPLRAILTRLEKAWSWDRV